MSSSDDSKILGVVLLVRHGDRQGFYQDPTTYTASNTVLTPLGSEEEFQLGQQLRSIYLNQSSPSNIPGLDDNLANKDQLEVKADAGGERGVIFNSAVALLQGLFPPTPLYNLTLDNGTTISGPLNGYQYVPISGIDPNVDVSLEGYTSCGTFTNATTAFYNSIIFKQKQADNSQFLQDLVPYVNGRQVTLVNMWNIFDYMNVQSIHNETFAKELPPTFLAQARALANFHEYGVFTSPQLNGIGNIAGQTILPSIINAFNNIANASNPVKFSYQAIAYKPFLSLFNMTGVAEMNPALASIVNYAAAVALEVREPASGGEPMLRFNFKNGSDDTDFKTYNFLNGTGDVPMSTFIDYLSPVAIKDTATWCTVCQNNQARGCGALAAAKAQGIAQGQAAVQIHQNISPVGAGFLGAGLTLAVVLAMLVVLSFIGLLTFGRKRRFNGTKDGSDTDSHERKF